MSTKASVAKDVFAYLLTFAMLYIGVVSFIALLWQIINVQFPDPVSFYYQGSYDAMRNAIASLIVVWPVFILMSMYIHRDIDTHPEKADIWVRRWLTYFTIFVAAMTMIIDLITLLNSFLSGELTTPFALKVLVILFVAAAVFGYEFWDLKREPSKGLRQLLFMRIGSIVCIIAAIIAGFFFVGSPTKARGIKLDNQRVSDLQTIQVQIIDYWNKTEKLPVALEDLNDPLTGYVLTKDPVSKESYQYTVESDLSFKLCATFQRETQAGDRGTGPYPIYDMYGNAVGEDLKHAAGYVCFQRTIDPARHKYPRPL